MASARAELRRRPGSGSWSDGPQAEPFPGADLWWSRPGVPADDPRPRGCPRGEGSRSSARSSSPRGRSTAEVVAIPGTNGKSTTTALVGMIRARPGQQITVGGTSGRPLSGRLLALTRRRSRGDRGVELPAGERPTTCRPRVAALLDLTPDHLDRHRRIEELRRGQGPHLLPSDPRRLRGDHPRTRGGGLPRRARAGRPEVQPARGLRGGRSEVRDGWVTARIRDQVDPVYPVGALPIRGAHGLANVLAAAACARGPGVPPRALGPGAGLPGGRPPHGVRPHERAGWRYYNDSKGTNVGATVGPGRLQRAGGPDRRGAGTRARRSSPWPRRRAGRARGGDRGGPADRSARPWPPPAFPTRDSPTRREAGGRPGQGRATWCCSARRAPPSTCSRTTSTGVTSSSGPSAAWSRGSVLMPRKLSSRPQLNEVGTTTGELHRNRFPDREASHSDRRCRRQRASARLRESRTQPVLPQ